MPVWSSTLLTAVGIDEPPAVGSDVKTGVGGHDSGVEQRPRSPVLKWVIGGRRCRNWLGHGGQFDHRSHLDIRRCRHGISRPESRHGLQHFRTAIDEERQGLLLMPGVEKC